MSSCRSCPQPCECLHAAARVFLPTPCHESHGAWVVTDRHIPSRWFKELYVLDGAPMFVNQLNAAISVILSGAYLKADAWLQADDDPCEGGVGNVQYRPLDGGSKKPGLPLWTPIYVVFALLNSLQNSLQYLAIQLLGSDNSNLCVLIFQAVIPMTAIMSIYVLGRSYARTQYLGMALVLTGVTVAFAPHVRAEHGSGLLGVALALVQNIPQGLLNVLTEKVILEHSGGDAELSHGGGAKEADFKVATRAGFEAGELAASGVDEEGSEVEGSNEDGQSENMPRVRQALRDTFLVVFWQNVFSFGFNFLFGVMLELVRGRPVSDLWYKDYTLGAQCLVGQPSGRCSGAPLVVALFAPFSVLYIVFQLLVVVYAGATAMFLVVAFTLPVQNYALASKAIMGSQAGEFHESEAWGLAVIAVGLVLYALREWPKQCSCKRGGQSEL